MPYRGIVIVVVIAIMVSGWAGGQTHSAGSGQAAGLPRQGIASRATPESAVDVGSTYELDVALDADEGTIGGSLRLEWVNTTGIAQESLPFRLYPNGKHYGDGSITVTDASVGDASATPGLADGPTVMTIPLGSALGPGETIRVELAFETVIPVDLSGSFGILQHVSEPGWWALADWYPVVAGWEAEEGWYLDPPTGFGDPTFASVTAYYSVTVEHPAELLLIGSGAEAVSEADRRGLVTTTFSESRLREFAMVAMPLGNVAESSFDVDGQPVTITLPAAWLVPGLIAFIENRVRTALPLYGEWFGMQSDGELDLTAAALTGALAVSWDQIIWFDMEGIAADGVLDEAEAAGLELVIWHELGHQWLAATIGTNSNDHTYLTEGLVNTLVVAIARESDGAEEARQVMGGFVAGPYRAFTNGNQDGIVDRPISDDRSGVVHSFLVYGKAGVGFEAIRQEIGDEAFFTALMRLGSTYAEGHFTPHDLRSLFEETSGQDLTELWSFWFLEAATEVEDVDAVVADSGD